MHISGAPFVAMADDRVILCRSVPSRPLPSVLSVCSSGCAALNGVWWLQVQPTPAAPSMTGSPIATNAIAAALGSGRSCAKVAAFVRAPKVNLDALEKIPGPAAVPGKKGGKRTRLLADITAFGALMRLLLPGQANAATKCALVHLQVFLCFHLTRLLAILWAFSMRHADRAHGICSPTQLSHMEHDCSFSKAVGPCVCTIWLYNTHFRAHAGGCAQWRMSPCRQRCPASP
jgi:hypothetical protein